MLQIPGIAVEGDFLGWARTKGGTSCLSGDPRVDSGELEVHSGDTEAGMSPWENHADVRQLPGFRGDSELGDIHGDPGVSDLAALQGNGEPGVVSFQMVVAGRDVGFDPSFRGIHRHDLALIDRGCR